MIKMFYINLLMGYVNRLKKGLYDLCICFFLCYYNKYNILILYSFFEYGYVKYILTFPSFFEYGTFNIFNILTSHI